MGSKDYYDVAIVHGGHSFPLDKRGMRERAATKPLRARKDPNEEIPLGREDHESLGRIDTSPLPPLDQSLLPAPIKIKAGAYGFASEEDLRAALVRYPGPEFKNLRPEDQKAFVKLLGQMVEVGVLQNRENGIDALDYHDCVTQMQQVLIAKNPAHEEAVKKAMGDVLAQGNIFFGEDQFYEVRRFRDNNPLS